MPARAEGAQRGITAAAGSGVVVTESAHHDAGAGWTTHLRNDGDEKAAVTGYVVCTEARSP